MKRGLVVAIGAATIVAGAAGCSSDNKASSPAPSSATTLSTAIMSSAPATGSTPTASGETKVIIAGQPQNVAGPVVCATNEGKFSIAIGDMVTGVIVGLEPDGSLVHTAGLGTVDGVVMSFTEGAPGNSAAATKNGNAYVITGTATGANNAGQQVSKTFEVDATCP